MLRIGWGKLDGEGFPLAVEGGYPDVGLTDDIHDAAQGFGTDWDLDGRSGVQDGLASDQTLSTVHGNGSHCVFTCGFSNRSELVCVFC